jgi:hypothetical protein
MKLKLGNGGIAERRGWDPDKALPWVAERLKLTFADSQTTAIRQALACKVLVIHKSQGSEYPAVIIPIMTQHTAALVKTGGMVGSCVKGPVIDQPDHRSPAII